LAYPSQVSAGPAMTLGNPPSLGVRGLNSAALKNAEQHVH
jgi:hypothetical protein